MTRGASAAAIATLILAWTGCGEERTPEPLAPPAARAILVGVDGADWKVIDALIAQGRLPNLTRMKAKGASGTLRSLEPIFSPVLWATIATGMEPDKHGIESFTVEHQGRRVPVTSNLFRVPRVWEILSRLGRTVGVLGWWTSWPAEPVNGFLCSERTWPLVLGENGWPVTSDGGAPVSRRTYPEELYASVEELIVTRHDLGPAELERVDVSGAMAMLGTGGPAVADIYAKDLTFLRMTEALYPRYRPEFLTLYLELPDAMSHYFWQHWRYSRYRRFQEPTEFSTPPGGMDPRLTTRVGVTFEKAYEFVDHALGRVLALADERTLVLVVSDHGYGENPKRRRLRVGDELFSQQPDWHVLDGVILAAGYGVAPGTRIEGASVRDVTPTLLYALGEPVGSDMDGRVLRELFTKEFARRPVEEVESHTGDATRDPTPLPSPEDEQFLEQLRALGYVE